MNVNEVMKVLETTGVLGIPNDPGYLWNVIKGYLGDKAIDFDTEAIEGPNDYKIVFNNYKSAIRNDLKLSRKDYDTFFDIDNKRAGISITIDGEKYSSEWKQDSDWVSEEFFQFIQDVLEPHLPGRIVHYISLDQCYREIYIPNKVAETVNEAFRQYEKKHRP